MKSIILAGIILSLSCQLSFAATTTGGHVACVTKDKLDEFHTALASDDEAGMNYLMGKSCIITKGGLKISVLDRSWTVSKIRVYLNDDALILWTPNENISE